MAKTEDTWLLELVSKTMRRIPRNVCGLLCQCLLSLLYESRHDANSVVKGGFGGCRRDKVDIMMIESCHHSNFIVTGVKTTSGVINDETSNGSWCMGIKGEMSGMVCVTFTWYMYISIYLYIYIYIWVVYSLCFFCCLFITVTWLYVWCIEWASGNQEEGQACLVTVWLFIISCYSLYKTTLGLFCSWFENNPHFHKYSMDFHV